MTYDPRARPRVEQWTKARVEGFLATEATAPASHGTYLMEAGNVDASWSWLPDSAIRSPTGLFLVGLPDRLVALAPPFAPAVPFDPWHESLQRILNRRRLLGVVLLRLGHYAVGVVDNDGVIASKSGSRYVHGRHRAGGQSQRRWERNRDQWIDKLFDEVCETWRAVSGQYVARMEGLVLGGDRLVLGRFLKHCQAAGEFSDRIVPRRVDVERPGSAALARTPRDIWSCTAYVAS